MSKIATAGLSIEPATVADLDDLVPLFEAYREFYRCTPDAAAARGFLEERLAADEAVILLARDAGSAVGFAALYPAFATLKLARIFELEDLFVAPVARRHGVGAALLARCEQFARERGAHALTLMTAGSNRSAQRAYEAANWSRDDVFVTYNRRLS